MRYFLSLIVVGALTSALAEARLPAQENPIPVATASPQESYVVQLTEYRLISSFGPDRSAADILEHIASAKNDETSHPVETIRVTALSGSDTMAQFGRRAAVTVGTTSTGRGTTARQTQFQQIGTMLRLTATPQAGKVLIKLSFESSRFDGEGTADSPPSIVTTQYESMQLVEIGKPSLIGGTTAGDTSCLVLTVTRSR